MDNGASGKKKEERMALILPGGLQPAKIGSLRTIDD